MKKYISIFTCILMLMVNTAYAKTVKYQFDINKKSINVTGEEITALAVGDQIPGPTIEATVGDILEVTFNNKMDVQTSIHWHGVILPNDQDGVPYLTTPPIEPHSSFTYHYEITHSGTYWYHSHTGLQEQRGVYGSLVFYPKDGLKVKSDHDYVVVLSDWTNENPNKVLDHLKQDGDYYALKKGTVQSWTKVFQNGKDAITNRLQGSWSRMGTMDLSDVGYDAFLANGKQESSLNALPGETVRLRLINASTSSYFNVEFAGAPMTIVSSDGVDVEPIKVERLRIAIAETYDIIVPIKDLKSYELRSSSVDGTGYSSIFIGKGEKVLAPDIPKPNLFLMNRMSGMSQMKPSSMMTGQETMDMSSGHMQHNMSNNNIVEKESVIKYMDNYKNLRATQDTNFSLELPRREVKLDLTGNMERYVWSFNNKTLLESNKILIKKGEIVQFVLKNKTMMSHPVHLHGHFFRVLNGQGNRSPLKHTVNLDPMETVVIEFEADEEKDWFFHCHNLYHMKAGMARVVSYEDTTTATRKTFEEIAHDSWYSFADIATLSNMTMGKIRTLNTRSSFELEYDSNYNKEYDVELIYAHSFTRFLDVYAGGSSERDDKNNKPDNTAIFGARYMLPLLIESDLRVDSEGDFRLRFSSNIQLTDRTKFEWSFNTDNEYRFSIPYEINKMTLLSATYDSDFRWGFGLRVKF